MTLTVGTDSYIEIAQADTYHLDRNNLDWATQTDPEKEAVIRKATDYLDRTYDWIGEQATQAQRLEWPRTGAYDSNGFLIEGIPWQVEEATSIVADLYRQGSVDLEGVVSSDRAVKKEKVDVIEVEYDVAFKTTGGDVLTHVTGLIQPLLDASRSGWLTRV